MERESKTADLFANVKKFICIHHIVESYLPGSIQSANMTHSYPEDTIPNSSTPANYASLATDNSSTVHLSLCCNYGFCLTPQINPMTHSDYF